MYRDVRDDFANFRREASKDKQTNSIAIEQLTSVDSLNFGRDLTGCRAFSIGYNSNWLRQSFRKGLSGNSSGDTIRQEEDNGYIKYR